MSHAMDALQEVKGVWISQQIYGNGYTGLWKDQFRFAKGKEKEIGVKGNALGA